MKRLVLVTMLVVAIVAIPSVPAGAGTGLNTVRVDKVVTGNGPDPSTEFEFEVDCGGQITELSIEAGGSDAVGAGVTTCTVVETENRGATNVSFACSSLGAVCGDDGATVQFPESSSPLTATITVTNDFGGAPTSSTTSTTDPSTDTTAAGTSPAASAAVSPTFTG